MQFLPRASRSISLKVVLVVVVVVVLVVVLVVTFCKSRRNARRVIVIAYIDGA